MTCPHCRSAREVFGEKRAGKDLLRYRRKGPDATTRALLDLLACQGAAGLTVLDVGGGVGVIGHELAARGAALVTTAEASDAYLRAAREEAEHRGWAERARWLEGDFTEVAAEAPEADIVTLDRVVCCYPGANALVEATARRARRALGLAYPRDRLGVRLFVALQNLLFRLRRLDFRLYVHPPARIAAAARRAGLEPARSLRTFAWEVATFARDDRTEDRA